MGWNDHLPDPDAWEQHVEALRDRADDARKRTKETAAPETDTPYREEGAAGSIVAADAGAAE